MRNCASGNPWIPGSRFARPGMTGKERAALLALRFCIAATIAKDPSEKGNGVSASFSVLVRLAYKVGSGASTRFPK